MTTRFGLHEEPLFRAFLQAHPRVVVLLRGDGCPYSATFEKVFAETAAPPGWETCLRMVEDGGRGPAGDALGVEITPTVVAFTDGEEAARLEAKLLLGIPRTSYQRWLKTLRE